MINSRLAVFLVTGILVLLLFLAACISAQHASSAPANASDALLQNASATTVSTVSANKDDTIKGQPSPELLKELRKFGLNHYQFGIHKWEFGPETDEITLYAYSIHNQSQVDALQGTHIGNYTIRILHDIEFERTQRELVQNLTLLQQDSRYQIDHFYTPVDPFGDPPGRWIELWCNGYTPENKKLDNTLMMGWRIFVYPMSPLPSNPKTTIPKTTTSGQVFKDTNFSPLKLPPEIQHEIQLATDPLAIDKWEFDPVKRDQINVFVYDIHNENEIEGYQGKRIGNYTLHIIHDTEFETTRSEVSDYLLQLRKTPDYQIAHVSMITNSFEDPIGYYAELWCYDSTPQNKKLEGVVIKGWTILVYPMSPLPTPLRNI